MDQELYLYTLPTENYILNIVKLKLKRNSVQQVKKKHFVDVPNILIIRKKSTGKNMGSSVGVPLQSKDRGDHGLTYLLTRRMEGATEV